MPARQLYEAPHQQLRDLGVEAKREGLTFEEFWERALRLDCSPTVTTESVKTVPPPDGAVVWPRDSSDQRIARAAIVGTEEGWRRAYEGVPPNQGEVALTRLNELAVEAAGGMIFGDAVALAT